jgi:hypothetical protein
MRTSSSKSGAQLKITVTGRPGKDFLHCDSFDRNDRSDHLVKQAAMFARSAPEILSRAWCSTMISIVLPSAIQFVITTVRLAVCESDVPFAT